MTMQQIKYFVTVARCMSFTKAAAQLFITQPALSRHIRNMEEELNIQLFVRTANGIRLTPAGSSFYMGMSEIYKNYIEQVDKANKIQKGLSGELRIGILNQMNVADFMPLLLQYFETVHPNVDLSFTDASFDYLISELYAGRLDIILTVQFDVDGKEGILYQYVSHSDDYIVMSKFHPLAQKEHVTLEDVKNETFVMISREDTPISSSLVFDICKEHGFVPPVHFAKTLSEMVLWIEIGKGIAILDTRNNIMFNPHIRAYKMESHWDPSLVMAWNQHNYNPLIEVFIKKINEILHLENEDIHGVTIDM